MCCWVLVVVEKQRSVCVITQQETSSGTAACRASRCSGARSWPVGWASDCRWMVLLRSAKVSLAAHPERCLICIGALPVLCLALLALPLVVRLFCTLGWRKAQLRHCESLCLKLNIKWHDSWCLEVTDNHDCLYLWLPTFTCKHDNYVPFRTFFRFSQVQYELR